MEKVTSKQKGETMWIKTDEGKLVNIAHFHTLEVEGWADKGYYNIRRDKHYPYTVQGITSGTWDRRQLAFCDTEKEAQRILDNIYNCIDIGHGKVKVADLRNVEYSHTEIIP